MKTIKILFCAVLLFSSCLRVDHETRRNDAEGLTYRYGFYYVDNTISKFLGFYKNGDKDEFYEFKQLSDSTWKCSYNFENCSLTGQIVKYKDNDTISFSFEGYDISDDYSLHVFTTEDIVYQHYEFTPQYSTNNTISIGKTFPLLYSWYSNKFLKLT